VLQSAFLECQLAAKSGNTLYACEETSYWMKVVVECDDWNVYHKSYTAFRGELNRGLDPQPFPHSLSNKDVINLTGSGALANVVANWQGSIGPAPLISATVTSVLSILVIKRSFAENVGTSSNLWRPLNHALQSLSGVLHFLIFHV